MKDKVKAEEDKPKPVYSFNVNFNAGDKVKRNVSMTFTGEGPDVFDEAIKQIETWKKESA